MKLSKFIILLFLQFLYSLDLSGIVYSDNQDKMGDVVIELEAVALNSKSINVLTDINGEFFIKKLDDTVYNIKANHIGFKPYSSTINLNKTKEITIILESEVLDLDRIVVTGTRSERHIKNTPILTHVITNDDISNSSYSNVKDILEMAMPNVQAVASNHGDDRVKIQGLDNKYLTFLIDGERVVGEFAGNIDFSMFGLSNVEKIEVVEGAISTLYGSSAMGGVINIITKKNNKPYWFDFNIKYDAPLQVSESSNLGFSNGIVNYNFNMQFSQSDGYDLTPNGIGQFNNTLDENDYRIFSHKLNLKPSDKHNYYIYFKDYASKINRYTSYAGDIILDSPLNRYSDKFLNLKYNFYISNTRQFKISYISEKYTKYYYLTDLSQQYINGLFDRNEFNLQYDVNVNNLKRLFGLEFSNDSYSSFNVPGLESIFSGEDMTKDIYSSSFYFYEERDLKNNNILSYGLRLLEQDKIIPSISYLIKDKGGYNYRLSYSSGYRKPAIKELYYSWTDHSPSIYGNSELVPARNNYVSFSLDKRTIINDFSVDFYSNNIKDMISTQYESSTTEEGDIIDELHYQNYDEVQISGMNIHYYRKVSSVFNIKFVYNLTNAESNSDEILEGISKHAFRINLNYGLAARTRMIFNIKYGGSKFVFNQIQNSYKELSPYWISDLFFINNFDNITIKSGFKNIFDYKDNSRLSNDSPEILNNYDPGRRFFFEFKIGLEAQ